MIKRSTWSQHKNLVIGLEAQGKGQLKSISTGFTFAREKLATRYGKPVTSIALRCQQVPCAYLAHRAGLLRRLVGDLDRPACEAISGQGAQFS